MRRSRSLFFALSLCMVSGCVTGMNLAYPVYAMEMDVGDMNGDAAEGADSGDDVRGEVPNEVLGAIQDDVLNDVVDEITDAVPVADIDDIPEIQETQEVQDTSLEEVNEIQEEVSEPLIVDGVLSLDDDLVLEDTDLSGVSAVNLNGHTLCLASTWYVMDSLAIYGQGAVVADGIDALFYVTGSLDLCDGAVLANPGGRGIHVSGGCLNLYDGTVQDCGAAGIDGGGVFIDNQGCMNMHGGSIANNTGSLGGGICATGGCSVGIFDGFVSGNSALDGAGIYVSDSLFSLYNGSVARNTASNNGGGIFAGELSQVEVRGNACVTDNAAGCHGGGVYAGTTFVLGENAVVERNLSGECEHAVGSCVFQEGLCSCANVGCGAPGLLVLLDDAYVEGFVLDLVNNTDDEPVQDEVVALANDSDVDSPEVPDGTESVMPTDEEVPESGNEDGEAENNGDGSPNEMVVNAEDEIDPEPDIDVVIDGSGVRMPDTGRTSRSFVLQMGSLFSFFGLYFLSVLRRIRELSSV